MEKILFHNFPFEVSTKSDVELISGQWVDAFQPASAFVGIILRNELISVRFYLAYNPIRLQRSFLFN